MLTIATVFVTSFIVALSGALMPGPLLMVAISESPRRGFITGPLLIVGHGLLEGILVISIITGLSPFLKQFGVFEVIAILGAAMLIFMARGMVKEIPSLSLKGNDAKRLPRSLLLSGAVVSLANPYWSLWWMTVGLGYILWSMKFGVLGIVFFFLGHILADFIWYSSVSLAFSRGKKLFSDRSYRILVGVCAVFLFVFALYFLYAGLSSLYRHFSPVG